MKMRLTLLAAMGCLMLATSCNKPEETTQYATNKAGERLVEKITSFYDDGETEVIRFEYNSDGTLKKVYEGEGVLSFERNNDTLQISEVWGDDIFNINCYLNKNGWIVLYRGWEDAHNYHLTYDAHGYLHDVFEGDELLRTFEWKEGNIVNEEVTYIPTQSNPSNIDWCAFFQTWRRGELDENLIGLFPFSHFFGFSEGYLGNKCKGLPSTMNNGRTNYSYDFDHDGFVSTIYVNGKPDYRITYLKK